MSERTQLALMAGNRTIREVGQGKEPLRLWDEEVIAQLRENYDSWVDNKSTDREYVSYYGVSSTEDMVKDSKRSARLSTL